MKLSTPFSTAFTAPGAVDLARALTIVADPNRLRILHLLFAEGEMAIMEIRAGLDYSLSQPTVSHHVKKLAEAGLVITRKHGVFVFCKVDARAVADIATALSPWSAS